MSARTAAEGPGGGAEAGLRQEPLDRGRDPPPGSPRRVGAGRRRAARQPAQLQQVIHNLIRNAIQASEPGAAIDVQLECTRLPVRRPRSHGELPSGAYARIRVSDTGRGMDEATRARIFEPFFTTRPAGTGLGLATAFEFVDEQGGAFDVRSAPDVGSAFEVWLPVHPEVAPGVAAAAGGTVMIVGAARSALQDDEETLAALGCEPIGYTDPDAALAALPLRSADCREPAVRFFWSHVCAPRSPYRGASHRALTLGRRRRATGRSLGGSDRRRCAPTLAVQRARAHAPAPCGSRGAKRATSSHGRRGSGDAALRHRQATWWLKNRRQSQSLT